MVFRSERSSDPSDKKGPPQELAADAWFSEELPQLSAAANAEAAEVAETGEEEARGVGCGEWLGCWEVVVNPG